LFAEGKLDWGGPTKRMGRNPDREKTGTASIKLWISVSPRPNKLSTAIIAVESGWGHVKGPVRGPGTAKPGIPLYFRFFRPPTQNHWEFGCGVFFLGAKKKKSRPLSRAHVIFPPPGPHFKYAFRLSGGGGRKIRGHARSFFPNTPTVPDGPQKNCPTT